MADLLRAELVATGWRIVNKTPLPVVCFTRDGIDVAELIAELRERQIAWMSDVQIAGEPAVRACVTSFKTTEKDVEWVVREMNAIVSSVPRRKTA
jgi:threonine aldolase